MTTAYLKTLYISWANTNINIPIVFLLCPFGHILQSFELWWKTTFQCLKVHQLINKTIEQTTKHMDFSN